MLRTRLRILFVLLFATSLYADEVLDNPAAVARFRL